MNKQLHLFSTVLSLLMCFSLTTKAQDHAGAFITIWDTQYMEYGSTFTISSTSNNYQYYWEKVGREILTNSGIYKTNNGHLDIPAIKYNSGVYRVYIKGSYKDIRIGASPVAEMLTSVQSWGNIAWNRMTGAFSRCTNLTTLPAAAPNLTNVTNMNGMFNGCASLNSDINNWNVDNVYDMARMFTDCIAFNQNIANWNVSKVTTMAFMFYGASVFNQSIGNWNVTKVTDMSAMFADASSFNQNLGSWKLNALVIMHNMFDNSGLSSKNYGLTLKGWADERTTPNGRTLGAAGIIYDAVYQNYRDKLTENVSNGGKYWTITDAGTTTTLPVNLISFTATLKNNGVQLAWATATESNNSHFVVERSTNGKDFSFLAIVSAKNENGEHYTYTDYLPKDGVNYYSLTQIDKNGTATELDVSTLTYRFQPSAFNLYPNPTSKQLKISTAQKGKIFKVYNAQGKIVLQQFLNQTQNSVDVSSLPIGLYFYNYGNEKGKFVKE